MINDSFDLFCLMKIGEKPQADEENNVDTLQSSDRDDVACACETYLLSESYLLTLKNKD